MKNKEVAMRNKRLFAIGAMVLSLNMCSSAATGVMNEIDATSYSNNISLYSKSQTILGKSLIDLIINNNRELSMLEEQAEAAKAHRLAEARKVKELSENYADIKNAINLASNQINKTWYVFSGSTPSGWDCSGLVLWVYSHLDIDLYHSATVQMQSGDIVDTPKFGDIVGFSWDGSSRYYHVGIYISEDLMLHAGGKDGDKTELRAISSFGSNNSIVSYSRLIDTP
jgi:cell wall-associated NlpC family hydrolase